MGRNIASTSAVHQAMVKWKVEWCYRQIDAPGIRILEPGSGDVFILFVYHELEVIE